MPRNLRQQWALPRSQMPPFPPVIETADHDDLAPNDTEFTEALEGFIDAKAKFLALDWYRQILLMPRDPRSRYGDGKKVDSRAGSPLRKSKGKRHSARLRKDMERSAAQLPTPRCPHCRNAIPPPSLNAGLRQTTPTHPPLMKENKDFQAAFEDKDPVSQLDFIASLISAFTQQRLESDETWQSAFKKEQLKQDSEGKDVRDFTMKYNLIVAMHMQKLLSFTTGGKEKSNESNETTRTVDETDGEIGTGSDTESTPSHTIRIMSPQLSDEGLRPSAASTRTRMSVHTLDMRAGPHTVTTGSGTPYSDDILDTAVETIERYAAKQDLRRLVEGLEGFANNYLMTEDPWTGIYPDDGSVAGAALPESTQLLERYLQAIDKHAKEIRDSPTLPAISLPANPTATLRDKTAAQNTEPKRKSAAGDDVDHELETAVELFKKRNPIPQVRQILRQLEAFGEVHLASEETFYAAVGGIAGATGQRHFDKMTRLLNTCMEKMLIGITLRMSELGEPAASFYDHVSRWVTYIAHMHGPDPEEVEEPSRMVPVLPFRHRLPHTQAIDILDNICTMHETGFARIQADMANTNPSQEVAMRAKIIAQICYDKSMKGVSELVKQVTALDKLLRPGEDCRELMMELAEILYGCMKDGRTCHHKDSRTCHHAEAEMRKYLQRTLGLGPKAK